MEAIVEPRTHQRPHHDSRTLDEAESGEADDGIVVIEEPAAAPGVETRRERSARLALAAFVVLLIVAAVALLISERSRWFLLDEWRFLYDRHLGSFTDLFRPHNEHLVALPVVYYRIVWHFFGLNTYLPYGGAAIALHLLTAALLRVIMRRHGVGPWIATLAAGALVVFGAGHEDILWAFQITLVGGIAFGLVQLVLADRDGPLDRLDWLGLLAGAVALLCSGTGAVMVAVVALTVVLRRSWRAAAFHAVPLGVAYFVWYLIARPSVAIPAGPDQQLTVGVLASWLRVGETSTFAALGQFTIVAVLLAVFLVVGLAVAWVPIGWTGFRRMGAAPAALLVGGALFQLLSAQSRWPLGTDTAGASRYVYVVAATTLPALAVAADALVRRWRYLAIPLLALVAIALPGNIRDFHNQETVLDPTFALEKAAVVGSAAAPEAKQVPKLTVVMPEGGFGANEVTIGWLLQQERAGRIPPPVDTDPLTTNSVKVRLGLRPTRAAPTPAGPCREVSDPLDVQPTVGQVFRIKTPVAVSTRDGNQRSSKLTKFDPVNGANLVVALPGLQLRFEPAPLAKSMTICPPNG